MQEADWKQLRRIIPEARERFLKEKNNQIVQILKTKENDETDKFWKAMEYMDRERKILDDCLGDMRRSRMTIIMLLMYRSGMLDNDDLNHFSESMRRHILELA